ncbi:MAG: D-cysteine desulfhydrase family protein [Thermomicrobiales bacterium]
MGLTAFPRQRIATLPTPLHELANLSRELGGPRIVIKRDDLTGLAFGGNKTRKLEYLVADAAAQQATHLITAGGIQSNHVRQTAAAARVAGMQAALVLTEDNPDPDLQGNYLLDKMLDATCHIIPADQDSTAKMDEIAADLRDQGHVPYLIPVGGSSPVGALGYVSAMLELNNQLWEQGINASRLYHAAGSGGTQAGVVLGAALYGAEYETIGVAVSGTSDQKIERCAELIEETADLLGISNPVGSDDVVVDDTQVGEGYGIPTEATLEAIKLLALTEGIFLDPVYTGKAFAAMLSDIRAGNLNGYETVIFLHTGGTPALFAKRSEIAPILEG